MIHSLRTFSATRRCAAVGLSAAFLFFLVAIQPHRVHHFFDTLSHTHAETAIAEGDCEHHHDPTVPAQTRCVIQTTAQNSHLGQVQLPPIPFFASAFSSGIPKLAQRIHYSPFALFLRRAPPVSALFS
jgi:hypothetical protein